MRFRASYHAQVGQDRKDREQSGGDPQCTQIFDWTSEVTKHITLYAGWDLITHTVFGTVEPPLESNVTIGNPRMW